MVLNIDDFEVLKFYGYTSLIPINARINEVSLIDDNPREQIRYARLESFYNKVIEKAKEKCTNKSFNYCHFEDNKCVFCLSHIKTGHIIYIGKYDFEISIGLDVKQRFGPSYNFLFNKESYKNEE